MLFRSEKGLVARQRERETSTKACRLSVCVKRGGGGGEREKGGGGGGHESIHSAKGGFCG